jgi:hypothetical protein
MLALAKVTWEDSSGASYATSVTIENTSGYGACIRTRAPITIGSRLKVDWRGGRFSGVAKYCRQYREDFIVGIQRDVREGSVQSISSPAVANSNRPAAVAKTQSPRNPQPKMHEGAAPQIRLQASKAPATAPSSKLPHESNNAEIESDTRPETLEIPELGTSEATATQRKPPSTPKVKISMLTKWLRRESEMEWNDVPNIAKELSPEVMHTKQVFTDSGVRKTLRPGRPNASGPTAPNTLLQLEDIYRAKGIYDLRSGYSINKVVEMLNNNHARELPNEMKRASVLMALDVAGVSVDDVLRDAERRLDSLNSYEAEQEKYLAEYESRKVQENAEIQEEMERVAGRYRERLKLNMDQVTQLRSSFAAWQTTKRQEAENISGAMDFCADRSSETSCDSGTPLPEIGVPSPLSPEPLPGKISPV